MNNINILINYKNTTNNEERKQYENYLANNLYKDFDNTINEFLNYLNLEDNDIMIKAYICTYLKSVITWDIWNNYFITNNNNNYASMLIETLFNNIISTERKLTNSVCILLALLWSYNINNGKIFNIIERIEELDFNEVNEVIILSSIILFGEICDNLSNIKTNDNILQNIHLKLHFTFVKFINIDLNNNLIWLLVKNLKHLLFNLSNFYYVNTNELLFIYDYILNLVTNNKNVMVFKEIIEIFTDTIKTYYSIFPKFLDKFNIEFENFIENNQTDQYEYLNVSILEFYIELINYEYLINYNTGFLTMKKNEIRIMEILQVKIINTFEKNNIIELMKMEDSTLNSYISSYIQFADFYGDAIEYKFNNLFNNINNSSEYSLIIFLLFSRNNSKIVTDEISNNLHIFFNHIKNAQEITHILFVNLLKEISISKTNIFNNEIIIKNLFELFDMYFNNGSIYYLQIMSEVLDNVLNNIKIFAYTLNVQDFVNYINKYLNDLMNLSKDVNLNVDIISQIFTVIFYLINLAHENKLQLNLSVNYVSDFLNIFNNFSNSEKFMYDDIFRNSIIIVENFFTTDLIDKSELNNSKWNILNFFYQKNFFGKFDYFIELLLIIGLYFDEKILEQDIENYITDTIVKKISKEYIDDDFQVTLDSYNLFINYEWKLKGVIINDLNQNFESNQVNSINNIINQRIQPLVNLYYNNNYDQYRDFKSVLFENIVEVIFKYIKYMEINNIKSIIKIIYEFLDSYPANFKIKENKENNDKIYMVILEALSIIIINLDSFNYEINMYLKEFFEYFFNFLDNKLFEYYLDKIEFHEYIIMILKTCKKSNIYNFSDNFKNNYLGFYKNLKTKNPQKFVDDINNLI